MTDTPRGGSRAYELTEPQTDILAEYLSDLANSIARTLSKPIHKTPHGGNINWVLAQRAYLRDVQQLAQMFGATFEDNEVSDD